MTGENTIAAKFHPNKLRNTGDMTKLIATNTHNAFAYQGRFKSDKQVFSVGYLTSQKAHNALRWLIGKQGYYNEGESIVAWSAEGKNIPKPIGNTLEVLGEEAFFFTENPTQSLKYTDTSPK